MPTAWSLRSCGTVSRRRVKTFSRASKELRVVSIHHPGCVSHRGPFIFVVCLFCMSGIWVLRLVHRACVILSTHFYTRGFRYSEPLVWTCQCSSWFRSNVLHHCVHTAGKLSIVCHYFLIILVRVATAITVAVTTCTRIYCAYFVLFLFFTCPTPHLQYLLLRGVVGDHLRMMGGDSSPLRGSSSASPCLDEDSVCYYWYRSVQ